MAIAQTEYTPFSSLTASGVITTDTFNTWRKKTNGLIVLLDGGLSSSNLSAGAPSWTAAGATSIFGGTAVTTGDALTILAASSSNGLVITQTGAGAALRVNDVASDASPFLVDGDGNLIVGNTVTLTFHNKHKSSTALSGQSIPHIAAIGADADTGAAVGIFQVSANTTSGVFSFTKSRGSLPNSRGIITTGDSLGVIDWQGFDGTNNASAANIECLSTGTITSNSGIIPGILTFSTRPAGGAITERMRIDSAGNVGIGKIPTVPLDVFGAITSSGTITGLTLSNGTVSITGGAISGLTSYSVTGDITATGSGKLKGVTLEIGSSTQLTVTAAGVLTTSGAITGASLNATNGGISNAGTITGATTIFASSTITGVGLAAGTGTITGASLSVSGAIGGTSCTINGAVTGQSFVVTTGGSGAITTAGIITGNGLVSSNGIVAGGTITGATTISASSTITAGGMITGVSSGNGLIPPTGGLTLGSGGYIYQTGNQDGATNAHANVKISSAYGIGFGPSVTGQSGQIVPQWENAVWIDCRLGNLNVRADIIAYSTSDRKYKDNITNIANPLDKVAQINGVSFDWNDKQSTFTGRDIGVIAQEVEAVLPEVVTTRDDGSKAVKYDKMVALLIECVKELKAEIEELKSKVN